VLRLAAQFAAGVFLWQHGWRLPILGVGVLGLLATCFFVAAIANSINLLDGMDGLAAGVVGIIAAAYLAPPGIPANPFAFSVAWSVAGASAGFVMANFPPAKIFMGDAGSTTLGFGIAFLSLDFYRSYAATRPALIFPLLTAALPLLDAAFAVVRRLRSRASPFYGDRRHLYDRMFARGWTPRRIGLASYAITATLAAIALLGVRGESSKFWIVTTLSIAILIYAAVRLGSLRGDDRNRPAQNVNAPPMDRECGEPSSTG
jgi:UDP-GlcNAc:undecaprenyl-phosphate GlcNAc-1-phosphate transferase